MKKRYLFSNLNYSSLLLEYVCIAQSVMHGWGTGSSRRGQGLFQLEFGSRGGDIAILFLMVHQCIFRVAFEEILSLAGLFVLIKRRGA